MLNLHHLLAGLSPFGEDNLNRVFVPIDEPHGTIEATVEREAKPSLARETGS